MAESVLIAENGVLLISEDNASYLLTEDSVLAPAVAPSSDYPDAIDPQIATLRDDVDTFRANGLQHIAEMAIAAQNVAGTGLADFRSQPGFGGAPKFGNLSQALLALFRFEVGEIDVTWNPSDMDDVTSAPIVTTNFTFNRFTQPPIVIVQTIEAPQASGYTSGMNTGSASWAGIRESKLFAVNVTKSTFGLAASAACANAAIQNGSGVAIKAYWLALEPPFGFAEAGDSTKG